jgi:His-Xaa-Ser system protein HxsD
MEVRSKEDVLTVIVDANIYPEEVLFKCLYWYGDTFDVDIARLDAASYTITLSYLDPNVTPEWDAVLARLKRELIDFKLRQIVTEETKVVRELIIAKAFAYYDQEISAIHAVSDPVGFDPQTI